MLPFLFLCLSLIYNAPMTITKAYFRYDKDAVILKEGQPNDQRIFYLTKGTAVAEVKGNVVNQLIPANGSASSARFSTPPAPPPSAPSPPATSPSSRASKT
jgi:hypothetical protein